ncbi:MAG: winged helix-turn-helix domain-containing protein [Ekhidna sp.]
MKNFFYIHDVRVDPEINTITLRGKSHKMEPKIMHVLMCLVEAKGEVVSKQYLFETVWAETVVVEMVLTRAISELRRVLEDKPTDPKFIATISKSGYRLVAPVSTSIRGFQKVRFLKGAIAGSMVLGLAIVFGFLQSDPSPAVSSVPLTTEKGWEYHPALSENGEWVAYIGQSNNDFADIFLRSTLSDSVINLTGSNGFFLKPVWSPDGKFVAAYGNRDLKKGLHIISVKSGEVKEVIEIKTQYVGMSWSPSGNEISYVAYDSVSARHSLFKYTLANQQSSLIVETAPESWGDSEPRYSPDGKSLAFVRTVSEGDQDLYRLDLSSSTIYRLTRINRNILGFDWEDNQTLLLSSDIDGANNLWKLRVGDGESLASLKNIIKIPYGESIQNPTVKNNLLIGEKWIQDTDLIQMHLLHDSVGSNELTSTQWELHPDISSDGKYVVFCSNRSSTYEIWKYAFEDGQVEQLTSLANGFSGKPKWSPDGKQVAFESNATGSHQIYVMDADGNNLKQITDGQGDYINPTWSSDGSFVYCASNTDQDWNIWAQSLKNNRLRKIQSSGGYYLQEAGFGRTYISKLHQNGIWEVKMDGTEERIIANLAATDWGNWKVGARGIYYYNRSINAIIYYDAEKGEETTLRKLKINVPTSDPSFAILEDSGIFYLGKVNNYSGDLIAIRNY